MKNLTIRETIDLRTWLARCGKAGLAVIPARVCPVEIGVAELIAGGGRSALQASLGLDGAGGGQNRGRGCGDGACAPRSR